MKHVFPAVADAAAIALAAALMAVGLLALTISWVDGKQPDKVTICHATGSETNPYVELPIAPSAVYGPGGHFNEHEEDYFGPCHPASPSPSPTGTPEPSSEPSASPTPEPSVEPSPEPSATPSPEPSVQPSVSPDPQPTPVPTPPPTDTEPARGGSNLEAVLALLLMAGATLWVADFIDHSNGRRP